MSEKEENKFDESEIYQDDNYLKEEADISTYFKSSDNFELFECGQGFYQDTAEVLAIIGDKYYQINMEADIESSKQDHGDRLYWVGRISKVEWKEIPKPQPKEAVVVSTKPADPLAVVSLEAMPVIKERIKEFGAKVDAEIEGMNLDEIEPTEENLKKIKTSRAKLNADFKLYETQRISVEKKLTAPIAEMKGVYKEFLTGTYKSALQLLDDKKAIIVEGILVKKGAALQGYFAEIIAVEALNFLTWNKYKEFTDLKLNTSTSLNKYKEEIRKFIDQIKSDITLIEDDQYHAEIIVEYKKTLKCTESILSVRKRKEAEAEEKARIRKEALSKRSYEMCQLGYSFGDNREGKSVFTHPISVESGTSVDFFWSAVVEMDDKAFKKFYTEKKAMIGALKVQVAASKVKEEKETIKGQSEPNKGQVQTPPTPKEEVVEAPVVAAPLEVPVVQKLEETIVIEFRIMDTLDKARMVKRFMEENNINFENID